MMSTLTQNLYLSPSPASPTSPSSFSLVLEHAPPPLLTAPWSLELSTTKIFSITASRTFNAQPTASSSSAP